MPIHTISAVLQFEMPVSATDRREAILEFIKGYPNTSIKAVNGERPVDYCIVSGLPIFDDDDYTTDKEGNGTLTEYKPKFKSNGKQRKTSR